MGKQVRTLYSGLIVGLWFIAWGLACLFFYWMGPVWKGELLTLLLGPLWIVMGTVFSFLTLREILHYRKTGEVKVKADERTNLNHLKASSRGFGFLLFSMMILFLLRGFEIINDTIFVALIGPVFAVGSVVYLVSYYVYERKG